MKHILEGGQSISLSWSCRLGLDMLGISTGCADLVAARIIFTSVLMATAIVGWSDFHSRDSESMRSTRSTRKSRKIKFWNCPISRNTSLRMKEDIARTSDGVKRLDLVFASSCSSTVMMRGLGYVSALKLGEVMGARLPRISSIYLKGVLRHRWIQSSRNTTTLSASSVRFAWSDDAAFKARSRQGSEISQRLGSVGFSSNTMQEERRYERRSERVSFRAGIRVTVYDLRIA